MKIIFWSALSVALSALLLVSCKSQVKPLGEAPLQLKSLDFNTKITDLLPDKLKSKQYEEHYEIRTPSFSALLKKDTVYVDEFSNEKKPKWIEYRQVSYSSEDALALFDKFPFNSVNMATTLDNKLMIFNAVNIDISENENTAFIKSLDDQYGKHIKKKGDGLREGNSYTWTLNDRTIKYYLVYDDESNALKIEVDQEHKTMKNTAKELHFEGYLFVVDKKYESTLLGEMNSGDLAYFK